MDIINILPDSVANQIAAGEVVDRPASAVKELLENSLDAGATAIQLIVKDAGRTLIQVIDNGSGMSDSDARRAFERHATSKIHIADDLFALHTMGFRGEALASIAAVAQVELKTRKNDSELGTHVIIEGSQVKEQTPCTAAIGTSIAVKNLFYNIPARRNFLKKDSVEFSHIEEVFRRVALPNYNVAFSMHHNGRLLYDLRPGNFAQRIASLFGSSYNERLYQVSEQTDLIEMSGYVGKAEYVKRVRGHQYLFVNNRFIKHPGLSAAIERAYSELIPDRTYPAYFVLLKVDPSRIDVNIHPTKTEVRFIDESVIFSILRAATKKALGQFSLANELEFSSTDLNFDPPAHDYIPVEPTIGHDPHYNPFSSRGTSPQRSGNGLTGLPFHIQTDNSREDEIVHFFDPAPQESTGTGTNDETTSVVPVNYASFQFANRYIVTTLRSGVIFIDQQRAHQRILYERLMRSRLSGKISPQQLLFPVNFRLCASDSELINELLPDFAALGFVISQLTQNTYVVTATPSDINQDEIQSLIEQTLNDYKNSQLQKCTQHDKTICLSLAKQMSVSSGKPLKQEEMQQIIADLFSCQSPDISPTGQPTMFIMSDADIAEHLK